MSLNAAAERLGYGGSSQDSTWEIFKATWSDKRPMPEKEVFDAELEKMAEENRIKAINEEADRRVAAVTGDQTQVNQDLALAVGLIYLELRSQLSASTRQRLDPIAGKSQSANAIRLHALAMIQNPALTW
jgi:hypothetical protein